jgi:hypothetical protein
METFKEIFDEITNPDAPLINRIISVLSMIPLAIKIIFIILLVIVCLSIFLMNIFPYSAIIASISISIGGFVYWKIINKPPLKRLF